MIPMKKLKNKLLFCFLNFFIKLNKLIKNAIALDLPSDEKEIDEEDDISEEDEKFVVPDGYLSDGEKVDDDGGNKIQPKKRI